MPSIKGFIFKIWSPVETIVDEIKKCIFKDLKNESVIEETLYNHLKY